MGGLPPPLMIEKIRAKKSKRQRGSLMIEKVMIQLGAKESKSSCRKGGGRGHQRGTGDAENAGSQGQKPTAKATKTHVKATKAKKPKATHPEKKKTKKILKKKWPSFFNCWGLSGKRHLISAKK